MTNINQILQAIADLNFELGKANLEPHVSEVLEAALEAGVSRRCTEAKIDELKYWQWKTDGHIELSGKEVEDRLAHLQQELGEDGKGSY